MKAQSSWISEAHGKLGGAVFRHTRHGMVISTKRSPTVRPQQVTSDSYYINPNLLAKSYRQVYSSAMSAWRMQSDALQEVLLFKPEWMTPLQWWVYYSYSNALTGNTLLSTIRAKMTKHYPSVALPTLGFVQCINFPEIVDSITNYVDVSGWVSGFNRSYVSLHLSRRYTTPTSHLPLLYQTAYLPYSDTGSVLAYLYAGNWDFIGSGTGMWVYQRGFIVDRFTGMRYKFIDGWYQISIQQVEC